MKNTEATRTGKDETMRSFYELLNLTPGDMSDEEWEYWRSEYAKLSNEERGELARQIEEAKRRINLFTDIVESGINPVS
jgi:hypothetical protein